MLTIAVDAMGGDQAPKAEVEGAIRAARDLGVKVILVGHQDVVRRELEVQDGLGNLPIEIVLSPPSGLTVNSYILLPMKPAKGIREFSVGPNQKSGVARGAIAFGVEKVGDNLFRMVLATPLPPGEYGILTATPESSGESSKMYTFRALL